MPTCSQPKCRVAETGVCLEGHKQNCPHLIPVASSSEGATAELQATPTTVSVTPEPYRFHSGEKLTVPEASRLLNDRSVRMVLCAGAQWAGKTTFLARLGEMFRNGSFRKFQFAGSKTLCAFERASWLATINSGVAKPDTPRSYRTENDTFLHLRVRTENETSCYMDLLISDLAGETFPTAVASRDFCAEQRALARADHLVLFLDCGSLVDTAKRHSERDNALGFLRQVTKVKHDPIALHIHIIFSRWDYVAQHEQRQTHENFCKNIETDLRERYGKSYATLDFWRIAARPKGMLPTDYDIQSIFAHWLETPLSGSAPEVAWNRNPARDFSAFGLT